MKKNKLTKKLTHILSVVMTGVMIFTANIANAQCGNAVTNGSFRGNLTGWTRNHSGTGGGWVWDSYQKAAVMNNTSSSGYGSLSQTVSDYAVSGAKITLSFYVSMELGPTQDNRLRVYWGGTEYLDIDCYSSNSTSNYTTKNAATANVFKEDGPTAIYYVTLKIPHSGAATTKTLTFDFPDAGDQKGYTIFNNVYIPLAGDCPGLSTGLQPVFDCEANIGYLFQNVNSAGISSSGKPEVYGVDLYDGSSTTLNSMLIDNTTTDFAEIGSVGFNAVDGYIWGYRMGTNQLVRIGSDWSLEFAPVVDLIQRNYSSGEVDANGVMYLTYIGANRIERINLTTATPTLMAPLMLSDGTIGSIDFAINPVDGQLYALNNNGTTRTLVRINSTTGVVTSRGTYPGIAARSYGAGFFDNEGNYYVSANTSGQIYRFTKVQNAGTPAVTYMATGPETTANDGARCAFAPIAQYTISGRVWNDANGNAVKNGTAEPYLNTGTTATNGLWVSLVNSAGVVVSSSPVKNNGQYSLTADNSGNYTIILINENIPIGTSLSASELLTDEWVSTGTNEGGIAKPTNKSGIIPVTVAGANIENLNFGIQQLPESEAVTATIVQPDANDEILLNGLAGNPQLMNGSDPEDGVYIGNTGDERAPQGVNITSLPTNGELWYNGSIVTATDVTNATVFSDPSLFSVVVTGSGYTTTSFEYAYVDAAGFADPTPATYELSWEAPLFVSIISFQASVNQKQVQLHWITASEQNNNGFAIERSDDGLNWHNIGFVKSLAKEGNSIERLTYLFTDMAPLTGLNHYRLKQTDVDEKYEYSVVRSIFINPSNSVNIYPNPAKDYVVIEGLEGSEMIYLYNVTGRVVKEIKPEQGAINVSLDGLSEGQYMFRVVSANGISISQKIVKVK